MTLSDRLRGVPATVGPRICNDPSGCRRSTPAPDQARCEGHREKWLPEWRRRAEAKDLTGAAA